MSRPRVGFLAAVGFVSTVVVAAAPAERAFEELPAAVKEAARKVAPTIEWKTAAKSKQSGKASYYVVSGTNSKSAKVWAEVTLRGKVLSIATEVAPDEVPKNVGTALKDAVSRSLTVDFMPTEIAKVERNGRLIGYRFMGDYWNRKNRRDTGRMMALVDADCARVELIIPNRASVISRTYREPRK